MVNIMQNGVLIVGPKVQGYSPHNYMFIPGMIATSSPHRAECSLDMVHII